MVKKYYSVGKNNTWTTKPITEEYISKRGFTIIDSRLCGDKQLFFNGTMVGWLFENKKDQVEFLKDRSLI